MEQHDLNKVFLSVSGMTIKSKSENVPKRLENAMSRWCESGEVSCESQNEVDLYIQGKGLTLRNDTVGVHGTVISSNLTNPINDFTSGMHMNIIDDAPTGPSQAIFNPATGTWEGEDVDMSGFESDESTELAPSVSYQTPTSIPVNKEADRECVGRNRPRSESANAAVSRSRFSKDTDFDLDIATKEAFTKSTKKHHLLLQNWKNANFKAQTNLDKNSDKESLHVQNCSSVANQIGCDKTTIGCFKMSVSEEQRRSFLTFAKELTLNRVIYDAKRLKSVETQELP